MFVLPIIIAKNCQWDKFRNWLDFIAKATVDFFVMLITFFFYVWHLLRLWNPMSHRIWNFRQMWFMILSWIDSLGLSKLCCSFSHLISFLWGVKMQFELYQNIKCTWKGGQDLVRVRRSTDRSIFSITCRSTAALTTCDNLILWRTIEEWNPDWLCAPLSNILLTWPDTKFHSERFTLTLFMSS